MTQLSLTARNFLDRVVCLGACPNHTRTSTIKRSKLPEKEIPEDQGDTRVRGGGVLGRSACDNPTAKVSSRGSVIGNRAWTRSPTQTQRGHAGVPKRPPEAPSGPGPARGLERLDVWVGPAAERAWSHTRKAVPGRDRRRVGPKQSQRTCTDRSAPDDRVGG